jgi:heme/copper-type cytochrome/quinol oxidase subunit 3
MDKLFFLLLMWIYIIWGHLTAKISSEADDELEREIFGFITIALYVSGICLGIYGVIS